jgi:hypothetical protein
MGRCCGARGPAHRGHGGLAIDRRAGRPTAARRYRAHTGGPVGQKRAPIMVRDRGHARRLQASSTTQVRRQSLRVARPRPVLTGPNRPLGPGARDSRHQPAPRLDVLGFAITEAVGAGRRSVHLGGDAGSTVRPFRDSPRRPRGQMITRRRSRSVKTASTPRMRAIAGSARQFAGARLSDMGGCAVGPDQHRWWILGVVPIG